MLVVSLRDMAVDNGGAVTPATVWRLQPVEAATAWSPPPAQLLSHVDMADPLADIAGAHVCFIVHGFNVDRDGGYTELGALAQELAGGGALLPGEDLTTTGVNAFAPVLWPGDWILPINYPFLLGDIRKAAQNFADLVNHSPTGPSRISFVTHSMGARVVLETVQRIVTPRSAGAKIPIVDTVVFTAAAVSDDVLDDATYAAAVGAFRRIVVLSSVADETLRWAFPAGEAVERALWFNDRGDDTALGRDGPKLKPNSPARSKISWYSMDTLDHSQYLPRPSEPTPGFVNGWSAKSLDVARLAQAIFDDTPTPVPAKAIS